MKILKFITLALVLGMFVVACGSSNDEAEKTEETTDDIEAAVKEDLINSLEKISENQEIEKSGSCEEYLDKFEKWADKYIEMLGKVKNNPSDATLAMEYAQLAPEMAKWAMEWQNQIKCQEDEAFVKRHKEIIARIDAAAEELE